ncbi:MAG TPA: methyltransferase domain-containing protein [Fimbriimonas sp.]
MSSSLDLGVTPSTAVLDEEGVTFEPHADRLAWPQMEACARDDRKVWEIEDGVLRQVQRFSETTGWVRVLCPTATAPTVLVSGIPMHRIKNTDPLADTRAKIRAFGPVKGRVLDTATGLGYTAIEAAKLASEVVTIELDPAAIDLARQNPWSQGLFEKDNIRQIVGDAYEEAAAFPPGSFSGVIHDPPTMSLGGELYSEEFYRHLKRLLARRGRLFHYIGDPDSGLGKRLYPGIMRRLTSVGFTRVERHPEAFGLTALA